MEILNRENSVLAMFWPCTGLQWRQRRKFWHKWILILLALLKMWKIIPSCAVRSLKYSGKGQSIRVYQGSTGVYWENPIMKTGTLQWEQGFLVMNTGFSLWELTYREFPVSLTGFEFAVYSNDLNVQDIKSDFDVPPWSPGFLTSLRHYFFLLSKHLWCYPIYLYHTIEILVPL